MKEWIDTVYSEEGDITFLMKETQDEKGNPISTECVGWYYGAPTEKNTEQYIGKLKAEY